LFEGFERYASDYYEFRKIGTKFNILCSYSNAYQRRARYKFQTVQFVGLINKSHTGLSSCGVRAMTHILKRTQEVQRQGIVFSKTRVHTDGNLSKRFLTCNLLTDIIFLLGLSTTVTLSKGLTLSPKVTGFLTKLRCTRESAKFFVWNKNPYLSRTRVPGLPIGDCAGSCKSSEHTRTTVDSIQVTPKVLFER